MTDKFKSAIVKSHINDTEFDIRISALENGGGGGGDEWINIPIELVENDIYQATYKTTITDAELDKKIRLIVEVGGQDGEEGATSFNLSGIAISKTIKINSGSIFDFLIIENTITTAEIDFVGNVLYLSGFFIYNYGHAFDDVASRPKILKIEYLKED